MLDKLFPHNSDENPEEENKKGIASAFLKWMSFKNGKVKTFFLISFLLLAIFACITLGYFCIYLWLQDLWDWGFGKKGSTWRAILAVFGAIYLVLIPLIPLFFASIYVEGIITQFADEAEKEFNDKLDSISKQQLTYEQKLELNDELGLIPLVTYSRIELEQYYKIGLTQTQRSYTYSVIAMWIGLIVIIFGICIYFIPPKIINPNFASGNTQILVIASGIFTEFISALFLWIYKSSINNLTYFYSRQIFIHNTLLAFKISTSMIDGDQAKKTIVEKILDFGFKSHNNIFERAKSTNASR